MLPDLRFDLFGSTLKPITKTISGWIVRAAGSVVVCLLFNWLCSVTPTGRRFHSLQEDWIIAAFYLEVQFCVMRNILLNEFHMDHAQVACSNSIC